MQSDRFTLHHPYLPFILQPVHTRNGRIIELIRIMGGNVTQVSLYIPFTSNIVSASFNCICSGNDAALDHSIKALTLSSSYLYSLIIHIFSCKDITIAKVILTLMNKF